MSESLFFRLNLLITVDKTKIALIIWRKRVNLKFNLVLNNIICNLSVKIKKCKRYAVH